MLSTRREWLWMAGSASLFAQRGTERAEQERRISQIVHDYEQQGIHRTATETDRNSGGLANGRGSKGRAEPGARELHD
jgi:hypothetical protein